MSSNKIRLEIIKKRCKTKSRYLSLADRAKKLELILQLYFMPWKELKSLEKKQLSYRERNREEIIKYYQQLRNLIKKIGSKSIVFID